jgi:hypothetical protein
MTEQMQIEDFEEMLGWLADRPALPLPIHGAWAMPPTGDRYGEDGEAFHTFVSQTELEGLASLFDHLEESPPYPFNPTGARRRFGSAAYEVLLDDDLAATTWHPWSLRRFDRPDETLRSARISGLLEMAAWLRERQDLPFPTHAAKPVPGDEREDLIFGCWAADIAEREMLAESFDRFDKPDYLPSYVDVARRSFAGGIGYEIVCGD